MTDEPITETCLPMPDSEYEKAVQQALACADAGDFAPPEDLAELDAKWGYSTTA